MNSTFSEPFWISGTNEDDGMFFKDNSVDSIFCFDHSEQLNPIFDYHLNDKQKCSDFSDQQNICKNYDLKNNCFVDKAIITESIIPNLDSYEYGNMNWSRFQNSSYSLKHDISSMFISKDERSESYKYANHNHSDDMSKQNQSKNTPKTN